jgi:GTPase SAR1 family protein
MYKCKGYVYVKAPNHPFATKDGYVKRSRLIMEKIIGRFLTPEEIVHHINEIKDDDRPKNLKLFPLKAGHTKLHILLNKERGIHFKRTKKFCKQMSETKKKYFKTHKPWMTGRKHTPEALKKMQKTMFQIGHSAPKTAFKKGFTPWNKGTRGICKAWNKGLKFSHN